MVFLSDYRGKYTGAIKETMSSIKVRTPDIEVIGINFGGQSDGDIAGISLPTALVNLAASARIETTCRARSLII
jgi:hypothetical protein